MKANNNNQSGQGQNINRGNEKQNKGGAEDYREQKVGFKIGEEKSEQHKKEEKNKGDKNRSSAENISSDKTKPGQQPGKEQEPTTKPGGEGGGHTNKEWDKKEERNNPDHTTSAQGDKTVDNKNTDTNAPGDFNSIH